MKKITIYLFALATASITQAQGGGYYASAGNGRTFVSVHGETAGGDSYQGQITTTNIHHDDFGGGYYNNPSGFNDHICGNTCGNPCDFAQTRVVFQSCNSVGFQWRITQRQVFYPGYFTIGHCGSRTWVPNRTEWIEIHRSRAANNFGGNYQGGYQHGGTYQGGTYNNGYYQGGNYNNGRSCGNNGSGRYYR